MLNFDTDNSVFNISCGVRQIKAFHPSALLQPDFDTFRLYLDADAKLLWFHQYCAEQGVVGKIITAFSASETLDSIVCSEFEGGTASVVKEFWTATVYIDGTEVAVTTSSGTYAVNDRKERDNASKTLRKYAISAALSQAGFGIISGFKMSDENIAALIEAGYQADPTKPNNVPALTTPPPAQQTPPSGTTVMQDPFFGSSDAGNTPVTVKSTPVQQTQPLVQQLSTSVTPAQQQTGNDTADTVGSPAPADTKPDFLTAAKQLVWGGNGPMKGKTLGQILGEPGGISNIEWIVNKFTPRSDAGRAVKEAAALILASVATGK